MLYFLPLLFKNKYRFLAYIKSGSYDEVYFSYQEIWVGLSPRVLVFLKTIKIKD
jgi:hypothetical protein